MKGNQDVIAALNEALSRELTGHNQYFAHGSLCDHWGYKRLAQERDEQAKDELAHARKLFARVLLLAGTPAVDPLRKVAVGKTVPEQFGLDHALVSEAVQALNKSIALAVEVGDNGSRELFEEMLESEEHLLHWLETQLALIEQVGVQDYLAQQIRS